MISQDAFDEMVQENINDFDMSPEEALAETIKQCKSMSLDLSQVDITGKGGKEEILELIVFIENSENYALYPELVATLETLNALCSDKHECGLRNQNLMYSKGGMNALMKLLNELHHKEILKLALEVLITLSKTNIKNRDFFEPGGSDSVSRIVASCLPIEVGSESYTLLCTALRLARVAAKTEFNKLKLMQSDIPTSLFALLSTDFSATCGYTDLLREVCSLMKALCTHDDTRKEMSCAYENGRQFIAMGVVPPLMRLSLCFREHAEMATAALQALRQLVVTEESVKLVAMHGAMSLPAAVYQWDEAPVSLIRAVTGLMRNLCADDERKGKLTHDGTLNLLMKALTVEANQSDAQFVEHAFACFAAVALRSPSNAAMLVNGGAIDLLVRGMHKHADRGPLQRQACLAVRNIAARCKDLRASILDSGIENMLRAAGRMQESVDEAYGALRDLECEVQYVKVNADGTAESMYEHFGQAKPKFNPVYDDTVDIDSRIEANATAPFREEHVHDHNCSH